MPLLRTETIHGWVCKFYDNDRVMVGTTARRFTMNVPADETSWIATRPWCIVGVLLAEPGAAGAVTAAPGTPVLNMPQRPHHLVPPI